MIWSGDRSVVLSERDVVRVLRSFPHPAVHHLDLIQRCRVEYNAHHSEVGRHLRAMQASGRILPVDTGVYRLRSIPRGWKKPSPRRPAPASAPKVAAPAAIAKPAADSALSVTLTFTPAQHREFSAFAKAVNLPLAEAVHALVATEFHGVCAGDCSWEDMIEVLGWSYATFVKGKKSVMASVAAEKRRSPITNARLTHLRIFADAA